MEEMTQQYSGLSEGFKDFLKRQQLDNRARSMVDAMMEEDPSLDVEQAYLLALRELSKTDKENV